jgi:dihydrolipoamide dehydrogenase
MQERNADVAIIGAGTAGMAAWQSAMVSTRKILMIEAGEFGTTCARAACMPSKLLIAAATAARDAAQASIFGIRIGSIEVDGAAVMDRVRRERDRFVAGVLREVQGWPPEQIIHGAARFVGPQTLQVDDHSLIHARSVVIATGSHPVVPAALREALGDRLIVSEQVFDWLTLPRAVAVLGTGPIGLEFAQALAALGVRVSLFGREPRFGPLSDPALQAIAAKLIGEQLDLQIHSEDPDYRREGDEVVVRYRARFGVVEEARFDYLIAATGRKPALETLDLEAGGIEVDFDGNLPFQRETCQIGNLPVFMAGDSDADDPLLHVANEDGRIAGSNAANFPQVQRRTRQTPLAIVFSAPQMACVGRSHHELEQAGVDTVRGCVSFEDQGRARLANTAEGALHVYAGRDDGKLLGAEMIGPAAEHLAHLLAWAIQAGERLEDLLQRPFYHPVYEEAVRTALSRAQEARKQAV